MNLYLEDFLLNTYSDSSTLEQTQYDKDYSYFVPEHFLTRIDPITLLCVKGAAKILKKHVTKNERINLGLIFINDCQFEYIWTYLRKMRSGHTPSARDFTLTTVNAVCAQFAHVMGVRGPSLTLSCPQETSFVELFFQVQRMLLDVEKVLVVQVGMKNETENKLRIYSCQQKKYAFSGVFLFSRENYKSSITIQNINYNSKASIFYRKKTDAFEKKNWIFSFDNFFSSGEKKFKFECENIRSQRASFIAERISS